MACFTSVSASHMLCKEPKDTGITVHEIKTVGRVVHNLTVAVLQPVKSPHGTVLPSDAHFFEQLINKVPGW
jgi:hypothetical protein